VCVCVCVRVPGGMGGKEPEMRRGKMAAGKRSKQEKGENQDLQHTATHCNALQRTATHCNTHTESH